MSWLIKLLFFFLLVTLVQRILAKLLGRSKRGTSARRQAKSAGPRRTISGQTVKDPQCGMYVASDLAIAARPGGETVYFCSEKCRDEFLKTDSARRRENSA